MVGSIICGVDESASAQGAAQVARGLSGKLGLRPRVRARRRRRVAGREDRRDCREARAPRRAPPATSTAGAHWLVEVGHPADRLVAAAADADASMIVVGSHGPRSSLLGSVSADVSRRAPCPVVVVPPGAEDRPERRTSASRRRRPQRPRRSRRQQRRRHRPLRSRLSSDVGRRMPRSRGGT